MSKKIHLTWHDIELYLEEKISKNELSEKKEHYINDFLDMKKDLFNYKKQEILEVYQSEIIFYNEKIEKNRKILKGLIMIFPEDKKILEIIKDLS